MQKFVKVVSFEKILVGLYGCGAWQLSMEVISIFRNSYLCCPFTSRHHDAEQLAITKAFKTWSVIPDVSHSGEVVV